MEYNQNWYRITAFLPNGQQRGPIEICTEELLTKNLKLCEQKDAEVYIETISDKED